MAGWPSKERIPSGESTQGNLAVIYHRKSLLLFVISSFIIRPDLRENSSLNPSDFHEFHHLY
jgi:hypothetical protein